MYSDKRFYPRYDVNLPVELFFTREKGGDLINCSEGIKAVHLAINAIELLCTKNVMDELLRQKRRPVISGLHLNNANNDLAVDNCRLLRHRRLSQNQYCLAFIFPELDSQQQHNLQNVITSVSPQAS
jgi:hypothetical protein